MSTIKTLANDASVDDIISSVDGDVKKANAFKILEMYKDATKVKPKMWGSSIIAFGQYHYKSDRSRQDGDWPLTGFSSRKQNLTLYIMLGALFFARSELTYYMSFDCGCRMIHFLCIKCIKIKCAVLNE